MGFTQKHFPKDTVAASSWCRVCEKETMHRVQLGRLGCCDECLARRTAEAAKKSGSLKGEQIEMFGGER